MANKFSSIKDRVLQIAEFKGIAKEKFFEKIDMTYGNFKGEAKKTPLNSTALENIFTLFPDLNLEWLITGRGSMLKEPNKPNTINEEPMNTYQTDQGLITRNPLLKTPHRNEMTKIEYYDVDFAAGKGVDILESGKPAYEMVIPGFAGCKAFNVYGDSMEGIIKGGSIAFGRKLEYWHEYLEYGQIYGVVMQDGTRFLKYLRKSKDEENKFLLKSENPNYDDFEIPKDKIHNIWLIEGWMLKRV